MARDKPVVIIDNERTPTGLPRCRGIKKDGERCGAFAGREGFCYYHDPRISDEQKTRTRALGGQAGGTFSRMQRLMPPRLRGVFDDVVNAMADVQSGVLSPPRATALASLATAAVRVLEAGELEERLRTLEATTADEDDPSPPQYDDE